MIGETYSTATAGDWGGYDDDYSDQDGWVLDALADQSSRRRQTLSDPTSGLPGYLKIRDTVKLHRGKTLREPNKVTSAGKKANTRAGRAYPGKTKPLKSVTSNKMHAAVFPRMRVPVYMRKPGNKKDRYGYGGWGYGSGRGVTSSGRSEDVPVMSVQCPMPGGLAVTVQTDPVQKVTWGPVTRVEASDEAKKLVKEWREAVKDAKKAKGKGKDKESETDGDETSKPAKTEKKHRAAVAVGDRAANEHVIITDGTTPETTSQAETETTTGNVGNPDRHGFLKPPPPTPPDSIFHQTPSAAAALSMPTLPMFHRISDTQLVEQYRLQLVTDPEVFEKETRAIKKGLVDAKFARGGKPRLLKNEYTVELASREDAQIAERWARGQAKNWELEGLRSRGNSLSSPVAPKLELGLKMRGGEMEEVGSSAATTSSTKKGGEEPDKIVTDALEQPPLTLPEVDHEILSSVTKPLPSPKLEANTSTAKTKTKKPVSKSTIREVKKGLSRLNISEHVSKVTTYGTVRHQHSVKREAGDHGEKRTIKTWIEITEVYQVPSSKKLTLKDVAAAIEDEDGNGGDGEEWESDSDSGESEDDNGEKEIARMKKKGSKKTDKKNVKGKKSAGKASGYISDADSSDFESPSSSFSTSDSDDDASNHDSDTGSDKAFHDPNETDAEAIFRSLSRFGDVNAESISQVSNDLLALMSGLRTEGMLEVREEDSNLVI